MTHNPAKIAGRLFSRRGREGAYQIALAGVSKAHSDGNGYRLSVWREIKRTVLDLPDRPVEATIET